MIVVWDCSAARVPLRNRGRTVYQCAVLILPSSTETPVEPYPQWHYQYGLDAILLEIYEAVNGSIGTAA